MKLPNIGWKGIAIFLSALIFDFYVPEASQTVGGFFDQALNALLSNV